MKIKLFWILTDILTINASVYMAFYFRFDGNIPIVEFNFYQNIWILYSIVQIISFFTFKIYNISLKHISIEDVIKIALACFSTFFMGTVIVFFSRQLGFSRIVLLLSCLINITITVFLRFIIRISRVFSRNSSLSGKKTLIVGAGSAGVSLLSLLPVNYGRILGFIDDDLKKENKNIRGVPVLGTLENIETIIDKYSIEQIIIAIPSAGGEAVRKIISRCRNRRIPCRIIPSVQEIVDGNVTSDSVRDIKVDDLLNRNVIKTDFNKLVGKFNSAVLVTGAGGSIGSEISSQLITLCTEQSFDLILLDNCEFNLYKLRESILNFKINRDQVHFVLGDVRDECFIRKLFKKYSPKYIIHTAAYKHVPLLEDNSFQAFSVNVTGTEIVGRIAGEYGAEKFLFISTDKAVEPSSIMGFSKRTGELAVISMNKTYSTKYRVIRFGNVLNSSGSVIPLFLKQIKEGGPITITHPEISRFFMTIEEAVHLVLNAFVRDDNNELYVLDMGEPVKILELAENLIFLHSATNVEIIYSGLRPGEKLFEKLFYKNEKPDKLEEKILGAQINVPDNWDNANILEIISKTFEGIEIKKEISDKWGEYYNCTG